MDSIDGKIMHVRNLLNGNLEYRLRLRFMFIGESSILRVHKGHMTEYLWCDEFSIVKNLSYSNRGTLLEVFIKIETIITDLVLARLLGLFERAPKLEKKIDNMNINSKTDILLGCGMIDQNLSSLLSNLFQVRNGLAHSWHRDHIDYLGAPLKDNFPRLREDLYQAWKNITQVYAQEQAMKIDFFMKKMEDELSDSLRA
jgi:hypothetical protein